MGKGSIQTKKLELNLKSTMGVIISYLRGILAFGHSVFTKTNMREHIGTIWRPHVTERFVTPLFVSPKSRRLHNLFSASNSVKSHYGCPKNPLFKIALFPEK